MGVSPWLSNQELLLNHPREVDGALYKKYEYNLHLTQYLIYLALYEGIIKYKGADLHNQGSWFKIAY